MNYFYARTSTKTQNLSRQLLKAKELGIPAENIYSDKMSGKDTNRPEWIKLNNALSKGDCLIITSMSRLSRSLKDLFSITQNLQERGVSIKFLKENIDSKSPTGRLMLGVIGSVYEFEREMIVERVRDGVHVSIKKRQEESLLNASGHKWGGNKQKELTSDQKRILNLWINKTIKTNEAMSMLSCSRATLYNLKNKLTTTTKTTA